MKRFLILMVLLNAIIVPIFANPGEDMLQEHAETLMSWVTETKDFITDQAPEVIEDIFTYYTWAYKAMIIGGSLAFILGIVFVLDWDGLEVVLGVLGIVFITGGLIVALYALGPLYKIANAPKLFLLQKITELF